MEFIGGDVARWLGSAQSFSFSAHELEASAAKVVRCQSMTTPVRANGSCRSRGAFAPVAIERVSAKDCWFANTAGATARFSDRERDGDIAWRC